MEITKLSLPGENDYYVQNAYKVLRTNLQFCGQDIKVIGLTSCNENEGKTTIALHVAKSFSELDKKVLIIDADMHKSVIAGRNTTVHHPVGLSEVLTGMEKLADCIYGTQYPRLHILFAGQYPPNPLELLNGKYFTALLEATKQCYDYIIIDTPPLGAVIDAAVIAKNCDGMILVIGDSKIRYSQAQNIVNQLKKSDCKILGVVRNNAEVPNSTYYYKKKYQKYSKR